MKIGNSWCEYFFPNEQGLFCMFDIENIKECNEKNCFNKETNDKNYKPRKQKWQENTQK